MPRSPRKPAVKREPGSSPYKAAKQKAKADVKPKKAKLEAPATPKSARQTLAKMAAAEDDYIPSDDDSDFGVPSSPSKSKKGKAAKSPRSPATPKKLTAEAILGPKPAPTPPNTWRKSSFTKRKKIIKTKAMKLYRLAQEDFIGLQFERQPTASGYDCYLYKEQDVEQAAWKKHGGPLPFEWYLETLKLRHENTSPNKTFAEPKHNPFPRHSVAPSPSAPSPSRPKRLQTLDQIQREFLTAFGQSWVFDAMNLYMDKHNTGLPHLPAYTELHRQQLLPQAIDQLNRYPARPATEEMVSFDTELKNLRTMLECVPMRDTLNGPFVRNAHNAEFDGDIWIWSSSFDARVKAELGRLKEMYGIESKVVLVAAWLVYDASTLGVGSFEYVDGEWADISYIWLMGLPTIGTQT